MKIKFYSKSSMEAQSITQHINGVLNAVWFKNRKATDIGFHVSGLHWRDVPGGKGFVGGDGGGMVDTESYESGPQWTLSLPKSTVEAILKIIGDCLLK